MRRAWDQAPMFSLRLFFATDYTQYAPAPEDESMRADSLLAVLMWD
jgi:hypothetical protein